MRLTLNRTSALVVHSPGRLLNTVCLCGCSPSTPTFGGGGGSLFKDGSITSSLQAAKEAAAAEQEVAEESGKEQEQQVACMTYEPFWGPQDPIGRGHQC